MLLRFQEHTVVSTNSYLVGLVVVSFSFFPFQLEGRGGGQGGDCVCALQGAIEMTLLGEGGDGVTWPY